MYTVEEFDKEKTRVFKYLMFKKRTEAEIRQKFSRIIEENMLEDIIEYLKEAGYINDKNYIDRAINEFMVLKNLSLKEIRYKLSAKGVNRSALENYFSKNYEELTEYEKKSAKNIVIKKSYNMDSNEIRTYLIKKGYKEESIRQAFEEDF